MASSFSTASGLVVVTTMQPQQGNPAMTIPSVTPNVSTVLGNFLNGEPKVLGTVQIMIGIMTLLFGIVLSVFTSSFAVYSGIVFWGAVFYISSGALSVAADKRLNKCLVDAALSMNILSAITAGIAVILHILDLASGVLYSSTHGITGVLLVFSMLEFIVSVYISVFAWKAMYHSTPEQMVVIQNPNCQVNNVTSGNVSMPHTHQVAFSSGVPQNVLNNSNTSQTHTETQPSKLNM